MILSPAAQAVMKAAENAYDDHYSEFHRCADRVAAAALRAAAAHLGSCNASEELIRIAEELEGQ
jgi:hypothetical protein